MGKICHLVIVIVCLYNYLQFFKSICCFNVFDLIYKVRIQESDIFATSKMKTTSKYSFSSKVFIFFCLDFTKSISVTGDKRSFFYMNVETLAIFSYLIGYCCIWKGLVISVKRISVISKDSLSDRKSWARTKQSNVEREWFLVIFSWTR